MKTLLTVTLRVFVFGIICAGIASAETVTASKLPLSFEENRGQAGADIRFLARGDGFTLTLAADETRLNVKGVSIRSRLVGANMKAPFSGEEPLTGVVNYLRGRSAESWITGVPTFARVRYRGIYAGIDVAYYGKDATLEYDFIVGPGKNPHVILMRFDGMDALRIDSDGNLVLQTGSSQLIQQRPVAYQNTGNARVSVEAAYRLLDSRTVGFAIGGYDRTQTLVIDPSLSYSTLFGGSNGDDDGRSIAMDSAGNMYIAGSTTSTDFVTASPLRGTPGNPDATLGFSDAFVTKLSSNGAALIYSTYLGGVGDDVASSLAVDSAGGVVVGGATNSADFPAPQGAFRTTCNTGANSTCADGFVTKLSSSGGLVYSTYLGGTADDEVRGVAVDAAGSAYVGGRTFSTNFPMAGALSTDSSSGAFITKFGVGGSVVYSTYYGAGSGATEIRGIAVDSAGSVYVTGNTPNSAATATDVFLTKLNSSGTAAVYTTYIRGALDESGNGVAVDASGGAYVTGQTSSIDFTTTAGAFQREYGSGPLFRSTDGGSTWSPARTGISQTSFYALAIAPSAPAVLYAGADNQTAGGVFKSTDGGSTWLPSNTGLTDARIHALTVDPNNASIVYAGTLATGVFKSTNAGGSWSATTLNAGLVTGVVVDPANSSVVYAATDGNGAYKSINAGTSWTAINSGLSSPAIRSLVMHPTISTTLFAGTAAGIYRTTNGGTTWSDVSSGLFDPNINALVIDPRTPTIVYAATSSVGIFRSTNSGAFWFPVNNGLTGSGSDILASALAVDPSSGVLFAAIGEANVSRLYRSSTGVSWTQVGLNSARVTHLVVDRLNASNVYAATVGAPDAFVAKWNAAGTLVYSSYLGGSRDDAGNGIAVDSSGNAYVAGETSSPDFPVSGAMQATFAGGSNVVTDAFVAKVNATATSLQYASFLGGGGNDFGKSIAIDNAGNAAVTGQTGSSDFPTVGALPTARPGLLDAFIARINETGQFNYAAASRGAYTITSQGKPTGIDVGYARIATDSGSVSPSGLAIFSVRQGNVLVSEATVPAVALLTSGRIYAEIGPRVNTGLAIANPNGQDVILTFYFTDQSGQDFGRGTKVLVANTQFPAYLSDEPYFGPGVFQGTFTFTATAPVAVIALRSYSNDRESLTTTLPVTNLQAAADTSTSLFPHFADGGGWTTQFIVVNPTDQQMSGRLQFYSPGTSVAAGSPLTIALEGLPAANTFSYTIPPRTSRRFRTTGTGSSGGSVRLVPDAGNQTPSGVGVFSYTAGGIVVTEAGVPALKTATGFRLYAQATGTFGTVGSAQTGIAVANSSATPAVITLELTTLTGASTGLIDTVTVPANGQNALFIGQLPGFANMPIPFQGVLRVSTAASGVSMIGIRGRYNERSDFLITTTLPAVEGVAPPAGELFFPHFADGQGYTTQFILFNGTSDQSVSGSIRFFRFTGAALSLPAK